VPNQKGRRRGGRTLKKKIVVPEKIFGITVLAGKKLEANSKFTDAPGLDIKKRTTDG